MEFKYQIKMLSDWHTGSGLDSATNANSLVKKDDHGQPYIPGKTIKGLIKDAVEDMIEVGQAKEEALIRIFGKLKKDVDPNIDENQVSHSGVAFFSNVKISDLEAQEIKTNNLTPFLYRNIASTAIGANGVAEGKSLRVTEVTTPLNLQGYISNLNQDDCDLLNKAVLLVRRLGVNRNRGLGRCKVTVLKKEL